MTTTNWNTQYTSKPVAQVGDAIKGDEWDMAHLLIKSDSWDRDNWGETTLRYDLNSDIIPSLPVQVVITGEKLHLQRYGSPKMRCQLIVWNDDEHNPTVFGGWIYLHSYRP